MSDAAVPFVDLIGVHRELRAELMGVMETALDTAGFVGAPAVAEFEEAFARYCGASSCVGMGSGTDALRLALVAAGVRAGDMVITVPSTFIATGEAITQAGAHIDLVDVEANSLTLDPEMLRAYLERECVYDRRLRRLVSRHTERPVAAIVAVHLYGQVADMDPILALARHYDLLIVEDACQAHGAEYFSTTERRWCRAGSIGHAAAFSFYPGKNLGACGEAGAVTTSDDGIAERCRMLRDHGQVARYIHEVEGYNARLDAIQAGVLSVKLRHLDAWNVQRRRRAHVYETLLADSGIPRPRPSPLSRPVHHLYVVQVADRDGVRADLTAAGIGTGIHYPVPLHLSPAYRRLGFRPGDFPVAERAAGRVLSLPMFPTLSRPQQERVVRHLLAATRGEAEATAVTAVTP